MALMSRALSAGEIYRRYNIAENQHDSIGITKLVAADLHVEVNGVLQVASAADDADAMDEMYSCYPDYRREILEIIEAGNRATVLWRMVGTPADVISDLLEVLDIIGVSVVSGNGRVLTRASLFVESTALASVLARTKFARGKDMGG
jgi:hypothetical protein